jgi:imidazolonepropionase-like amidohydrolase
MRQNLFVLALLAPPWLAGAGFAMPAQEEEPIVVVTNAVLFTGSGPRLSGATLVIRGGKVDAVIKAGDPVPQVDPAKGSSNRVIDAGGRFVTPGLVDGNCLLGVTGPNANEQSDEVTPHLRIVDSVDPGDPAFRRALGGGVTAAYVTPGNQNVIGGLGCVLKTSGRSVRDMLVREDEGLRIALGSEPSSGNRPIRGGAPDSIYYRRPTTRMGVVWEIRKAFYDAMKYRDERTSLAPGANGGGGPAADPGLEVLVQALSQKLKVRMTARAEQDIRTALRLSEEFGLKLVIDEATEAYKVLDLLVASGVPVVGAPPSLSSGRDGAEAHWNTLALLASHGVPVALQTGTIPGSMPLVREAAFALRHGMEWEQAMAAVTSVAADVLGVADRIGSLGPGKDADFVVWSGDPLDFASAPTAVFIDGKDRIAETPRSN